MFLNHWILKCIDLWAEHWLFRVYLDLHHKSDWYEIDCTTYWIFALIFQHAPSSTATGLLWTTEKRTTCLPATESFSTTKAQGEEKTLWRGRLPDRWQRSHSVKWNLSSSEILIPKEIGGMPKTMSRWELFTTDLSKQRVSLLSLIG